MDTNAKTVLPNRISDTEVVRFLTVEQFARRIGVHPQTVRKWDNTGVLKAHHKTPSGRRLYTEEQVSEYFKQQ